MFFDEKQTLFIIGSPRSGTTMLQIILGTHPKVATTAEIMIFSRYVAPWMQSWQLDLMNQEKYGWNQGLSLLWNDEDNDAFLKDFLTKAYSRIRENNRDTTHLLDKCPGYAFHVDVIKRFCPNAKFIHLIRDGRDVACSLSAAVETMNFGVSDLVEAGKRWREWVLAARNARKFGSDYLEVRYENLVATPLAHYEKIFEFCGIALEPGWLEHALAENSFERMKARRASADPSIQVAKHHYRKGKAGAWRDDFSLEDRYHFHRVAGDLLCELGYAHEDWWAETEIQKWSYPRVADARRRWAMLREAGRWAMASVTNKLPARTDGSRVSFTTWSARRRRPALEASKGGLGTGVEVLGPVRS